HDPHQRLGRLLQRQRGEASVRQRRRWVALGVAGVFEAEPSMRDAQDVAGALHLLPPNGGEILPYLGAVHSGVEDRSALTPRTRHDKHLDALVGVHRRAGAALARLIVGVGMDLHEAERLAWS